MGRKWILGFFVFGLALCLGMIWVAGCGTTSSSDPASPPSGVASIEVGSGGSATGEGTSGTVAFTLADKGDNTPITSTTYLNVHNVTIQIWATGVTTQSASVGTLTSHTATTGDPISFAMTLDRSGSMSSADIVSMEAAAKDFVSNMQATDQGAIINFGTTVAVDQGLTSTQSLLNTAIDSSSISGGLTALFDSMGTAVSTVSAASNDRKAVIAMTDGGENASVTYTTTTAVINHANTYNIPIYCVGLGITQGGSAEDNLEAIATGTGGVYYYAPSSTDLADLYDKISSALNNYWTVSFTSPFTFTIGTTYTVKITISYTGGTITAYTTFTLNP
ncbi:MAG: VWA domain-containing protein [Candidatus Saganbacteria bacterium]|nr:VWA domain-containing protein [Candidatus Saganbacteria bacterium]